MDGERHEFADRHIGPREEEITEMLEALGLDSLDALIEKAVPAVIRRSAPLDLPAPMSEPEVLERLSERAGENRRSVSLIGMGYHDCHVPEVIRRNVLESPAWYTAYTPYQPEVSQGRLEALLNFQQLVIDLTGLEIANASLLDEATAAAEAMAMSRRLSKADSPRYLADSACHPQVLAVTATRARALGVSFEVRDIDAATCASEACFGVLVQYPDTLGRVRDWRAVAERAHEQGALLTVAADPLAMVLVRPPGELGADIVVGSTQRLGMPMGAGGPHAAFLATRDAYKRSMPGRLIGVSRDAAGRPALRMALQTREQHIRREKATSNICTAQVLPAVMAAFYAIYHGPEGLSQIAERVHRHALLLAETLRGAGLSVDAGPFCDTISVHAPGRASELCERAAAGGFELREIDEDRLCIALDETTDSGVLAGLLAALGIEGGLAGAGEVPGDCLSTEIRRETPILTHSVFHRYRSETEMLRYIRELGDRDIALDRAMIPLGSCTMKLNATSEMLPLGFPGLAALHPYAPETCKRGYRRLTAELSRWLAECTGLDAVSLQPNAGSQGEFSGLLAIRAYHEARSEPERTLCLIPASAHGTNPASARMAGLDVVVVPCDRSGDVDVEALAALAAGNADSLAALMLTYPSTHGVYESSVREICEIVHRHGGQVYMDGANLNALLGLATLGELGADVCHINLHKTFCIPHGGGGPGMGPIAVRRHLEPYLPGDPLGRTAGGRPGPVAAAEWGSALVLPISWAYIALMGADGLRRATEAAVLAANYVARRLAPHYPVLYTGQHGLVAHECVIDLRGLKDTTGVSIDDVAKRLVDYGFHAPTMSFPVPGTFMIEPTESESKREIDRFCEAMISIRTEIADIEAGRIALEDSPLVHAPHTAEACLAARWDHPYSREQAAFPPGVRPEAKYWPPVGRVDNVFGDRHFIGCRPADL